MRRGPARWTAEENFQAGKGLAGLDEHQVRRWNSWSRWTTLAMLALAFMPIATLFAALIIGTVHDTRHRLRWSAWRCHRQHRAKTCHYQRQARQP